MGDLKPGWKRVKFGDFVLNSTKATKDYEAEGFTRYIIGQHIPPDGGRVTTSNPVGDAEFGSRIRTIIRTGDIICTTRGPNLKVAVATFDCLSAHTNFVMRPRDRNELLPGVLEAIVRSDGFQDHLRKHFRGSTNLFVNWSDAAQYEFALPPIDEQRRLAAMLQRSDDVLNAHRECLAASHALYDAALGHFFLRRVRGPGISPHDWATAGWSCLPLERVADPGAPISYGVVQPGDSVAGGVPTATSNNLNIGFDRNIHLTHGDIERQYARSRIRGGDVLVTVKGFGTGNIAVVPSWFSGNITRDVARVRLSDQVDAAFFVHLWKCRAFERYWRGVSVGTTRPELSIGKLREMLIPWPDRQVRERLVDVLGMTAGAADRAAQRLSDANALHRSLLMRALSGEA